MAGTPPFWSTVAILSDEVNKLVLAFFYKIFRVTSGGNRLAAKSSKLAANKDSLVAQLVRALH